MRLYLSLALVFLCLATSRAHSSSLHYLKDGYAGCTTEADAYLYGRIVHVDKDRAAGDKLIREGRCAPTRAGVAVYIMDDGFRGYVKVRPKGSTTGVWVMRGAISASPPKK